MYYCIYIYINNIKPGKDICSNDEIEKVYTTGSNDKIDRKCYGLKDVRKYQESTELLIRKSPFKRY